MFSAITASAWAPRDPGVSCPMGPRMAARTSGGKSVAVRVIS